MPILVCGDLHTKIRIFEDVKAISSKFEKVVFMGDYVDDWNVMPEVSYNLLERLVEWKKQEPDKVVLLWGNHDLSEWYGGRFECAGFTKYGHSLLRGFFDKNYQFFQLAFAWNTCLFTHAGLTKKWCEDARIGDFCQAEEYAQVLNDKFAPTPRPSKNVLKLSSAGYMRGGIYAPSPIWADKIELLQDPVDGLNQVVGHTPVSRVMREQVGSAELVFCDTHSTTPDGLNIGNNEIFSMN